MFNGVDTHALAFDRGATRDFLIHDRVGCRDLDLLFAGQINAYKRNPLIIPAQVLSSYRTALPVCKPMPERVTDFLSFFDSYSLHLLFFL